MQHNEPLEMPDLSFEELQAPPKMNQDLIATLDTAIKGGRWIQIHQCITMLRQICKYSPQLSNDIVMRYNTQLLDMFINGNTQILKNLLRWINQVLKTANQFDVEKFIYSFVPILLKKASIEKGHIKQLAQTVLTTFATNCGYQISFIIVGQYCCDKNIQIAQTSIKLFAALIQNIGQKFMKLTQNALNSIMRILETLIEGKRNNIRKYALDICIYLCKTIGSDNYLQLMNYTLKQQEVNFMGTNMQTHRVQKNKPIPLAVVLKQRKTQIQRNQFANYNQENCNYMNYN